MADSVRVAVPKYYWVVAGLAVLWNLFGCAQYFMQISMTADDVAKLTEAQRALVSWQPDWLNVVFAGAVFSGLAGAIGLFMRQPWAVRALGISALLIAIMFSYILGFSNVIADMGFVQAAGFPIFIFFAGLAQYWFARSARAKGWLR